MIDAGGVPLLTQAAALAQQGFVTGASHRNWSSYGGDVAVPAEIPEWRRHLLTDPQTSGGLLVAVAPERGAVVLATIRASGFPVAAMVGYAEAGVPSIQVAA